MLANVTDWFTMIRAVYLPEMVKVSQVTKESYDMIDISDFCSLC